MNSKHLVIIGTVIGLIASIALLRTALISAKYHRLLIAEHKAKQASNI